ncbi:sulfurtransferase [Diaminobutyricibacter tongyongensis]|uniref:Sulfurtransferase n=1 Tax=Leifsonia tongyongensis TaxID=1268043 RepID=A0A6L9Y0G9_9MICO|nr:sulfurtransferase [Diaminobutyricibacter tongyongensis]
MTSSTASASTDPTSPIVGAALDGPTVSTQWLADHLGSDGLVILDATVLQVPHPHGGLAWLSGLDQYLVDGHIPGSVFADLLETFSDPAGAYAFSRPDDEQFVAAAASVGVDNETTVIVYDSAVGTWAARVWWLFRAFGYDRVAILDGGLTKWKAEGRATELGNVEPRRAAGFTADERPDLWVDKAYVESVVNGDERATLVCAVPPKEFAGEAGQRGRLGHIPGSVNAPAGRLVSRETNALLPLADLRATFAAVLASPDPIVSYCGGGIAAAADALVLALLGRTDVAIYDGSLNEWADDEDAPLAREAA